MKIKITLKTLMIVGISLNFFNVVIAKNNIKIKDSFNKKQHKNELRKWNNLKRKPSSEHSYSESNLTKDFKILRAKWLSVKNAKQMEKLLKDSYKKIKNNKVAFSEDVKFFLAQMHLIIPLQGIVWRMRPIFEKHNFTHVSAVQLIRGTVSGVKLFFPTDQWNASIEFLTEPSINMRKSHQFKSILDYQEFLISELIPMIQDSIKIVESIQNKENERIFVWDNKMAFGTASFKDGIKRYSGYGPAERHLSLAGMYRAIKTALVFSSYNQDAILDVSSEIGAHLGIDGLKILPKVLNDDFGLTDLERNKIIMKAIEKKKFLSIRNIGKDYMKNAWIALKNSVLNIEAAHNYLKNGEPSHAMSLNPIFYSEDLYPRLDSAISNMTSLVDEKKPISEIRDPISGRTAKINLYNFYNNPPKSLRGFLPTNFELGEKDKEVTISDGVVKIRNYTKGRAIGWNNNYWKQLVPSAAGKGSNYMSEARRIFAYSGGTPLVFNLPVLFVR